MTTEQVSKTNQLIVLIIGLSIPIIVIVIAIIKTLMLESHGIVDTTTVQAAFFGGLCLALPCGIPSVSIGIKALSKGLISKKVAVTGIIVGTFSILIGLISWIWFFMISAFAAAFS